ncbi:MAG: SRPBCC domain-containing protein [Myxococcota bacterium]|jgi:hypothetical protein|nr:SRPBCC domain-containing protein [Myxococcota bacterium]
MRITTSIDIDAPVDTVWAILADFASYETWNPLTVRIDGEPRVDEVVTLHVELGGKSTVRKHVISRVEPGAALCWTIRTRKPWLMRGERCQTLEELGEGRCRYVNEECVEGLVSWIVALTYKGTIRQALEACGQALKTRSESP